ATDAEAAEQEARQYLEQHRIVEVWSTYHRRVARIVRKQDQPDGTAGVLAELGRSLKQNGPLTQNAPKPNNAWWRFAALEIAMPSIRIIQTCGAKVRTI